MKTNPFFLLCISLVTFEMLDIKSNSSTNENSVEWLIEIKTKETILICLSSQDSITDIIVV